jgi:predicted lactoylglutathione lyase
VGRLLAHRSGRRSSGHLPAPRRIRRVLARARRRVWRVGTRAGYRDDGAPAPRPQYRSDYYGGFLLDPDGNSIEAVHFSLTPQRQGVDHVWLHVADLAAAKRFYETIASHAGFGVETLATDWVQCQGGGGSFSLVAGEQPSAHVHMAFPAVANATVDAFHGAATSAGYRDNGAPGERSEYHPGYYGAFVLDPDGNNVEVVNHNR